VCICVHERENHGAHVAANLTRGRGKAALKWGCNKGLTLLYMAIQDTEEEEREKSCNCAILRSIARV